MAALDAQSIPEPRARFRLRRRWLLLAIVVVALATLGFKGWRIIDRLHTLRADIAAVQAAAGARRDQAALDALGARLGQTRADSVALRDEAAPFLPIARRLGWLPVYGPDLAAAPDLLDAAIDLSAAADDAFTAVGPLLLADGSAAPSSARIQQRLTAARPQLDAASAAIDRASTTWARIPVATLSPALRDQLLPIEQALPLARLALRLAPQLPNVIADLEQIQSYAAAPPDAAAIKALGPLLAKTRADVTALRAAATPLLAKQHADASSAPVLALLDTAMDLAGAADESYRALAPLLLDRPRGQPLGVALVTQLSAARPQLAIARQAADRAAADWARVSLDGMAPALRSRVAPLGGMLAALRDGLELADTLPELLGAQGPVDYMLLAQNPDELRATGGFMSAVGVLTLDQGRHSAIDMQNSPSVDDLANHVYPNPPAPLLRYMNSEIWLFRDANWSPDFPSSAKRARELYKIGTGRDYANVIAFDPFAAQQLLAAVGAVAVEGTPTPISAANVAAYLRDEHDATDGPNKKAYIGRLANAIATKLETQPGNVDLWKLMLALRRVLGERHVLLSLQHASAAAIAARHGWDGAVQPGPADFLMLVDSNLGYNKVNPNISQAISYTVDLSDPSAPQATLTLRYVNMVQLQDSCKQFDDAQKTYAEWMRRCYYDYVRVLLPHGSQLSGATTQPVPDAWMDSGVGDDGTVTMSDGEAGTSVLGGFLVVPFGSQREIQLRYRLPPAVLTHDQQGWRYQLRLQKQAGTLGIPFSVELRLPASASLLASSPAASSADRSLRFAGTLATDQSIELRFR